MKKLLRVLLMALLGVALTQPVLAYQNAIQIPTSSPLSGLTAIGDLNSAALNYVTLDSGASAPTTTSLGASGTPLSSLAGVVWHDTTTNTIKIRNQADTAWVTLLYLDETNGYGGAVSPVLSSSGAQTVGGSNHPGMFVATGAATYTLTHTTSLWNGFAFAVSAQGGAVTVSINGSDKINGGTSGTGTTIPQGYIGVFKTDGAGNWFLGFERGGPCGVSAGTYTNATITFDAMGCPTSASSGTAVIHVKIIWITTSETWTPDTGLIDADIECWGAGGAGGGAANSSTAGEGGGGGSGGYNIKIAVSAATIGASQTVTIGAGGTPGTAGNNPGNNGGDTSVGTLCVGKGGTGGGGAAANAAGAWRPRRRRRYGRFHHCGEYRGHARAKREFLCTPAWSNRAELELAKLCRWWRAGAQRGVGRQQGGARGFCRCCQDHGEVKPMINPVREGTTLG